MTGLKNLYDAILKGDADLAKSTTEQALSDGTNPEELVNKTMIPAMDEVGRLFATHEYFVPELLISARAMKGALELIRPLLVKRGVEPAGRVVIGTVKGDLHDIGKNLVASMLEGGGFEVVDLGVDVSADKFISAVQENKANIVAFSALLTTTMPAMQTNLYEMKKAGMRDGIKVMIGGAPVTQQFADEIGADGFADNANEAVGIARKLVGV